MKPFGLARSTILILIVLIAAFESAYVAFVSPMGEGADEWEHIDLAMHFAVEKRLPDLSREDVGQGQHPPLSYAVMATIPLLLGVDPGPPREPGPGVDVLGRRVLFRPDHRRMDDGLSADGLPERHKQGLITDDSTFLWMRLISVMLGLFSSVLFILIMREFFPGQPSLAVATAAFFILLPQWAAHFAFVSCDPYLSFLSCLATWLALRARRLGQLGQLKKLIPIALILGLAFLTKLHAIGIATFLGLMILGDRRISPRLGPRLKSVLILAAGPLFLAGWWHLMRVMDAGGPLVLDHHAAMKPWLLRVQEFHPVALLDVLNQLLFSFFGVITATSIAAPTFLFVVPMTLVVIGLIGISWPKESVRRRRRSVAIAPPEPEAEVTMAMPLEEETATLPIRAGILSFGLLVVAILIANQHYLHIHGRYFFAVLPVLGLILGRGVQRLCQDKAEGLLIFAAIWNLLFLVWTIQISLTQIMTVSSSKFERGHVIAYYDCGHRHFDDISAGGFEAVRQMRHLSLARHTIRATIDEGLSYKFTVADPSKALQVRLRYPDAALRGQGDLPMPSGLECFADGQRLHGLQSIGLDRGELAYLLPREVTEDGEIQITWKNRASGAVGLALAEIWIEETWLQADSLKLEEQNRVASFYLRNIDGESEHGFAFHLEDKDGLIDVKEDRQLIKTLPASGGIHLRLELARKVDPSSLQLRLRPDYLGPEVDFKLVYNRFPGLRPSGLSRLADIETLLLDETTAIRDLTAADVGPMPVGRYDLGIEESRPEAQLIPDVLAMDMEGATLGTAWSVEETDNAMFLFSTTLERPTDAPAFRFLIRMVSPPKEAIHINRLIIRRRLDDTSWGIPYHVAGD